MIFSSKPKNEITLRTLYPPKEMRKDARASFIVAVVLLLFYVVVSVVVIFSRLRPGYVRRIYS